MKRRLEDPEGKQSHKQPPTELQVEKLFPLVVNSIPLLKFPSIKLSERL